MTRTLAALGAVLALACGDDDRPIGDGSVPTDGPVRDGMTQTDGPVSADGGPVLPPVDGPGRIALGEDHSCHVRDDGTLFCWGRNDRGQLGAGPGDPSAVPLQVGTGSDWIMVSAEGNDTCGLRGAGALWCFDRDAGPMRVGTALWKWIDVGEAFFTQPFCGVQEDGSLHCWRLGDEPSRIGTDTNWLRAAAGDDRHCALRTDGSAWCWDTAMITPMPTRVGMETYTAYDFGQHWGCGTTTDGRLLCSGTFLDDFPQTPPGGGAYTGLSIGFGHGCAVVDDGTLVCNGTNTRGESGRPIDAPSDPTVLGDAFVEVATGDHHTCARRIDDTVACWGANLYGELGAGETGLATSPVRVGTATDWERIACGGTYTCGIRAGNIFCWGNISFGMIFDTVAVAPTSFDASGDWSELSAGGAACGIRTDGSLYCWGRNGFGKVGDGTTTDRGAPVRIGASYTWTSVSAASSHTCGIDGGAVYCWGRGNNGQLGNGSIADRSSPTRVGTSTWTDVTVGGQASCGVQTDGSLHCWGSLTAGDGERAPVRIGTAVDWTATSVAEASVTPNRCALHATGTIECAGGNTNGQLGDGTTTSRTDFAPAIGGPWDRVSAGNGYVCALARDASLHCWGGSDLGQTGLSGFASTNVPTRVGSDSWRELSAGSGHACAIRMDGALFCWGRNELGELGSGTPFSVEPLDVVR